MTFLDLPILINLESNKIAQHFVHFKSIQTNGIIDEEFPLNPQIFTSMDPHCIPQLGHAPQRQFQRIVIDKNEVRTIQAEPVLQ